MEDIECYTCETGRYAGNASTSSSTCPGGSYSLAESESYADHQTRSAASAGDGSRGTCPSGKYEDEDEVSGV